VIDDVEPDADSRLRFAHDKLREVAYDKIAPAQRRRLHRDAAAAIESAYQDTSELPRLYSSLAHHWGMAEVLDKTLNYLERAGERALAAGAYGEAVDTFNRALALTADGIGADKRRRGRWEHGLGKALFGVGDLTAAELHTRNALRHLGHPLPESRAGWARLLVEQVARQVGHRFGVGRPAPSDSDERADLSEAAQATSLITHRYYYVGDSLAMITASLWSVNLAERVGREWQVPRSYSWLGYIVGLLRRHSLADSYFRRAHLGARESNEPSELAFALCVESVYHIGFANWTKAEHATREALEILGDASDPQMREIALTTLGHIAFYTGLYADSKRAFEEVLQSARARANLQHATWGRFSMARALLQMDQLEEALPLLHEARRALAEHAELDSEIICHGLLAAARLRLGDEEPARRLADETLERIRRSRPIGFSTLDGYDGAAQVYLELWGRRRGSPEAASLARAADEVCASLHGLARLFPMAAPTAHLRSGQAALLAGQKWKATLALERSRRRSLELGMPRVRSLADQTLRQL
jgi:tetratricopeptide (TPR) repeat protein